VTVHYHTYDRTGDACRCGATRPAIDDTGFIVASDDGPRAMRPMQPRFRNRRWCECGKMKATHYGVDARVDGVIGVYCEWCARLWVAGRERVTP